MHYVFAAFSVSLKQDNLLLGKSCSVLSCVTLVYSFPNKQKQGCPSRWRWHVRARISDVYRGGSLSLLEKSILIVKPLRCRSLTVPRSPGLDCQRWQGNGHILICVPGVDPELRSLELGACVPTFLGSSQPHLLLPPAHCLSVELQSLLSSSECNGCWIL